MLSALLSTDIFKLLLILSRLGTAMMFMPGFNGTMVTPRSRLLLALCVSFVLLPTLAPQIPAMPPDPLTLFLMALGEITVGVFFGLFLQALMVPVDLAGNFISTAVGMTNAFVYDSVSAEQSMIITGFLNTVVVTLLFLTDGHHMMLRALVDSYGLFKPGEGLPMGDFSQTLVRVMGESFSLGMRLCAPLVIFSLVFNVALGLLNKLVPQMQVFFVGVPLQLLIGLSVMMMALPAMLWLFLTYFDNGLKNFLAAG